ncbi:MAG: PhzF family phenazine biosynthesis protein [Comamonas sp.]
MRERPFMQVDVFSETAYQGNPLAVVLDGEGLSDADMQVFARWTNLSETTFLLPPNQAGADYRVRIFTPAGELPFAGHPTLGSCHAWLAAGGVPQQAGRVVQECAKGLVPLQNSAAQPGRWAFAAPSTVRTPITELQLAPVLTAMGLTRNQVIACAQLNNGPNFWTLLLDEPDTVFALAPNTAALHSLGIEVGVAALYPQAGKALIGRASREARAFSGNQATATEPDAEVRVWFDAGSTLSEDPITGSFNASLAQWLIDEGHIEAPYTASQGVNMDRSGSVNITQDASGQVWVGGHVTTAITGKVVL